jgi:DNA-binding NarL/FixJ family response regulator
LSLWKAELLGDRVNPRLVADDHDLFRVGLASALATYEDIEVVAQASGGRMAVRLAAELRPDVILMDLRMPHVDGLEATREILEADPSGRVLVLTVATPPAARNHPVARSCKPGADVARSGTEPIPTV